jgi:hypothetical protein
MVHKRQDAMILTFSLTKASPGASHQYFLIFVPQSIFILQFDCALSLQDLYGTVATLRFLPDCHSLPLL